MRIAGAGADPLPPATVRAALAERFPPIAVAFIIAGRSTLIPGNGLVRPGKSLISLGNALLTSGNALLMLGNSLLNVGDAPLTAGGTVPCHECKLSDNEYVLSECEQSVSETI